MFIIKIRNKVKDLLVQKGMTQKELAVRTGLRESQISIICRNTSTGINKKQLCKIAEILEVKDIHQILDFN